MPAAGAVTVILRWPRSGPRRMIGPGRRPSRLASLAPQGDGESVSFAAVSAAACGGHLRPGIAQADRAVEHEPAGPRIRVAAEVTEPLELDRLRRIAAGENRLELAVGQHFERVRIEVGDEVADVWVC